MTISTFAPTFWTHIISELDGVHSDKIRADSTSRRICLISQNIWDIYEKTLIVYP